MRPGIDLHSLDRVGPTSPGEGQIMFSSKPPGSPAHGRGGLAFLAAIAALSAPAAGADALLTRNQNPLLAPFGFPGALPSRLPAAGETRVAATLNWANAAAVETTDRYEYTMDAELRELRLRVEHAVGPRFAAFMELPWREVSGGSLDGVVEDWHDLFGLPDGSRGRLPRNQLLIEYGQDEELLLQLDRETSGIADIPVALGYQVTTSDSNSLTAWLSITLPAGEANGFTGSGATDVALSLAGESRLSDRWQLFGQVDAVWLGQGEVIPALQEQFAWAALAGLSWNAWRALDLTVQLHANSRVFDVVATNFSGEAVVLSFGGSYRTQGGWRFDVGASEDIKVKASPDASFNFAVRRGF